MESIFGLSTSDSSNVPQVRYLQCPAGVKVSHLKRFVSSKYDLNCSNNSMNIDIIYEDEILPLELSLMDIAYCYKWERVSALKCILLSISFSYSTPHLLNRLRQ